MVVNWADQVGSVVRGWLLESYSGMRADRACFQAVNTSDARRALLQFIPAGAPEAGRLRTSWDAAQRLSDRHLLPVYEAGETQVAGAPVIYSAQERPDDAVGEILRDRVLDSDEARALSIGAAGALRYLHERGLRHGAVEPSNLFILGEEVKLSVDSIEPAAGAERRQDLVQFGSLLSASLGAERPGLLPAPFREIAEGCLNPASGWTAGEILQKLEAPGDSKPMMLPRMRRGAWIAAAAGAFVIVAIVALLVARRDSVPVVAEPAPTAAALDKPSPAVPFGASSRAAATAAQQTAGGDADRFSVPKSTARTWAVIAATYRDYDAAKKRADKIASATKVNATVYPPRSEGAAQHYVILGSGMTQQEADDLLRKARGAGAPGDSYVTKLVTDKSQSN